MIASEQGLPSFVIVFQKHDVRLFTHYVLAFAGTLKNVVGVVNICDIQNHVETLSGQVSSQSYTDPLAAIFY
jgi:hypothetical protein